MDNQSISFIPLGGIGDVTKNMYVYEYGDEILLVDCGIGFVDETVVGVDLVLPDITYLLNTPKKIVGMVISHGHEDHMGALPFVLPQLITPQRGNKEFPVYATPLTAALANEKLQEFGVPQRVKTVKFEDPEVRIGNFTCKFIRVTHSVPDTSHIFIKTPVGNFYHGSDFKFDLTPADGKKNEFDKIGAVAREGIMCLLSDCLGAERKGITPSEVALSDNFEREISKCKGKFLVTTYSSNISRLNQAIEIAQQFNRRVCFLGRSLIKAKEVAKRLGYMQIPKGWEIEVDELKKYNDNQLLLIVAGSQGQENSALSRIANDEFREVKLSKDDVVIFSSDPIPGNEISVTSLIDTIAKKGTRVVYSDLTNEFHVSGHGYSTDLMLLMSLTKAKRLIPIGGNYKHMIAYKRLAVSLGYDEKDILLLEDGQEMIFTRDGVRPGKKVDTRNIYVDEITGEEIESFVLRDRQKLSEGGVIIIMAEVDSANGQLVRNPDIIIRGLMLPDEKRLADKISRDLQKVFSAKRGRVTNWVHLRKLVGQTAERKIFQEIRKRPLVLPVIVEV